MPKATFINLDEEKKDLVIQSALDEFSSVSYDTASINQICKSAKIPKGSFYQYFNDKLDLYVYLCELGTQKKLEAFSEHLKSLPSLAFTEQIRILVIQGIEFAKNHPKFADLGNRFLIETNENAKKAVLAGASPQAEGFYESWIESAKSSGEVHRSLSTRSIRLMIETFLQAILDDQRRYQKEHGYAMPTNTMLEVVDDMLSILKYGIEPQKNSEYLKEEVL